MISSCKGKDAEAVNLWNQLLEKTIKLDDEDAHVLFLGNYDSAKRSQLGTALKRVEPDGAHGVRVWLEQAPFDDMIRWLGELKNNSGVRITSVTVDQQGAAGLVNARLMLEEGGG